MKKKFKSCKINVRKYTIKIVIWQTDKIRTPIKRAANKIWSSRA